MRLLERLSLGHGISYSRTRQDNPNTYGRLRSSIQTRSNCIHDEASVSLICSSRTSVVCLVNRRNDLPTKETQLGPSYTSRKNHSPVSVLRHLAVCLLNLVPRVHLSGKAQVVRGQRVRSEAPEKDTNLMNVGSHRSAATRPCHPIDYRPKAGASRVEKFIRPAGRYQHTC